MPIIKHNVLVSYSAKKMYKLVNNVEAYPTFLPWCKSIVVKENTPAYMIVQVQVSKGGVHKIFTTRNKLKPFEKIEIELKEGHLDHLVGYWEFIPLQDDVCRINFTLDFRFKNKLTGVLIQPLIQYIADNMVAAFVKRASEVASEN